jgi:CcmD family protein
MIDRALLCSTVSRPLARAALAATLASAALLPAAAPTRASAQAGEAATATGAQAGAPAAAPTTAPSPEPTRAAPEGFVPLPGREARAEQVDASGLVVGAYAAFFLGLLGYVVHVARRQAAIAAEVADLARKLGPRA